MKNGIKTVFGKEVPQTESVINVELYEVAGSDAVEVSCGQIIKNRHPVPHRAQPFHHMGADVPTATDDQELLWNKVFCHNAHSPPRYMRKTTIKMTKRPPARF